MGDNYYSGDGEKEVSAVGKKKKKGKPFLFSLSRCEAHEPRVSTTRAFILGVKVARAFPFFLQFQENHSLPLYSCFSCVCRSFSTGPSHYFFRISRATCGGVRKFKFLETGGKKKKECFILKWLQMRIDWKPRKFDASHLCVD